MEATQIQQLLIELHMSIDLGKEVVLVETF